MNSSELINKLSIVADKIFPSINNFQAVDNSIKILHYKETLPFQFAPTHHLLPPIKDSFDRYNSIIQNEYLYLFKGGCLIEPMYGWIILPEHKYLTSSLPYKVYPKPSSLKLKYGIKRKVKYEKVISIRYGIGNYWHFYNDIIGQLLFIQKQDIDPQIPILVPRKLLNYAYVSDFFYHTDILKSKKWVFQEDDELIQCQEVYLPKNTPNTKETFNGINNLLHLSGLENYRNERIFLKRGKNRGRRLINLGEVESLVKEFNYKVIDTDILSLKDQINLFRNASSVIGIHGAGLANLMFSNPEQLQVIEIFPANIIPPHYFWLCYELGIKYNAVLGSNQNTSGLFSLPVNILRDKLEQIHS